MTHPLLGWRIDELARHLNTSRPYVALIGVPGVGKTRLAARLAARFQSRTILLPPPLAAGLEATGLGLEGEIEFLHGLAGLLGPGNFPAGNQLVVSDFWFDQTLAHAAGRLAAHDFAEFRQAEGPLSSTVPAARLRVLLTTSWPPSIPADAPCGALDVVRLQDALCEVALRPKMGPILQLSALDEQHVLEEVQAAIEAMR